MSTGDRLDQIAARCNAATDGPWETWQASDEESTTWIDHRFGDVLNHDERGHGHMRENFAWMKRDDAEFIAHARTDVPALVAALRAVLAIDTGDNRNVYGLDFEAGMVKALWIVHQTIAAALGEDTP